MEDSNLDASQEALGKALDRAKMGEDQNLAARIRDLGERLVRTLYGLLKMTEIHDLSNNAFEKPIKDFNQVSSDLYEILGTLHLVTVEDQIFLNDIRIRMNQAQGATTLAESPSAVDARPDEGHLHRQVLGEGLRHRAEAL